MDTASEDTLKLFQQLKSTRSRIDKSVILRSCLGKPHETYVKELFSVALDWFRTFGISDIITYPRDVSIENSASICHFLDFARHIEGKRCTKPSTEAHLNLYYTDLAKLLASCLTKDLDVGVAENTVNKIWPGLLPTFSPMLAEDWSGQDLAQLTFPKYVEIKLDGVRALCFVKSDKVTFCSRAGKPLYNTEAIEQKLLSMNCHRGEDFVLDGELYVVGGDPAEAYNETVKVCRRSVNDPDLDQFARLRYVVFDYIPLSAWNKQEYKSEYIQRREIIKNIPVFSLVEENAELVLRTEATLCTTPESAKTLITSYTSAGFEGGMLKSPNRQYTFDRSDYWMKYKPNIWEDAEVVSVYEGSGRNAFRLGGLNIRLKTGKVCDVGGGFSDFQRNDFWANPPIGKIVEVKAKCFTPDGKLREPVFLRLKEQDM